MPPRSSTRLKLQMDKLQHAVTRCDEASIPTLSSTSIPEPIFALTADDALKEFPSFLKGQLDDYIKIPGADIKTFAGSKCAFDLHHTFKGEPARFVEFNTSNIMDSAIYQMGVGKNALRMVVVQPEYGSLFNGGEPAIIVFYGKITGMYTGRALVSRWAIWTPNGLKNDVFVDRLIIKESEYNSANDTRHPVPKRRRKNSLAAANRHDSQIHAASVATPEKVSGMSVEVVETVFMKQEHDDELDHDISALNSGLEDQDQTLYHPPQAVIAPLDNTSTTAMEIKRETPVHMAQDRRSRSLSISPLTSASVTENSPAPAGATISRTTIKSPSVSADSHKASSTNENDVKLAFRLAQENEARIIKTLAQCNSVQKLFAYGCKAGISNPTTILLVASINSQEIAIVRDDSEDFDELIKAIIDKQLSCHDGEVEVTIKPGTF